MNRWEKAISEIDDKNLKKVLDDVKALHQRYLFRYQIAQMSGMTGMSDRDECGKIAALMEWLEIFAKRELGDRMKKKAAEKAAKKESEK